MGVGQETGVRRKVRRTRREEADIGTYNVGDIAAGIKRQASSEPVPELVDFFARSCEPLDKPRLFAAFEAEANRALVMEIPEAKGHKQGEEEKELSFAASDRDSKKRPPLAVATPQIVATLTDQRGLRKRTEALHEKTRKQEVDVKEPSDANVKEAAIFENAEEGPRKKKRKQRQQEIGERDDPRAEEQTKMIEQEATTQQSEYEPRKPKKAKMMDSIVKQDSTNQPTSGDFDAGISSHEDRSERTVFVGNLPKATKRKAVINFFTRWGKVENGRLRSLPTAGAKVDQPGNQALVKRVSAYRNALTDAKQAINAYVVYENKESAAKAVAGANGVLWPDSDRHVRVDWAVPTPRAKDDHLRTAFVGNLPRDADEETLRSHFSQHIGPDAVEYVRVVRNKETHVAIGVGYVQLNDKGLLATALELDGVPYTAAHGVKPRPLRVKPCGKRTKRDAPSKSKPRLRHSTAPLTGAARRLEGKAKRVARTASTEAPADATPSWMGRRVDDRSTKTARASTRKRQANFSGSSSRQKGLQSKRHAASRRK